MCCLLNIYADCSDSLGGENSKTLSLGTRKSFSLVNYVDSSFFRARFKKNQKKPPNSAQDAKYDRGVAKAFSVTR